MELLACQLHRMWMWKVEGHRQHVLLWQPTSSSYKMTNSKQENSEANWIWSVCDENLIQYLIISSIFSVLFIFSSFVAQNKQQKNTKQPKRRKKKNPNKKKKHNPKKTKPNKRPPKPKPRPTNNEATAKQNPLFPKDLKFPLNFTPRCLGEV